MPEFDGLSHRAAAPDSAFATHFTSRGNPTSGLCGPFLATFAEYPPRQEAALFGLDQVMEKLSSTAGTQ